MASKSHSKQTQAVEGPRSRGRCRSTCVGDHEHAKCENKLPSINAIIGSQNAEDDSSPEDAPGVKHRPRSFKTLEDIWISDESPQDSPEPEQPASPIIVAGRARRYTEWKFPSCPYATKFSSAEPKDDPPYLDLKDTLEPVIQELDPDTNQVSGSNQTSTRSTTVRTTSERPQTSILTKIPRRQPRRTKPKPKRKSVSFEDEHSTIPRKDDPVHHTEQFIRDTLRMYKSGSGPFNFGIFEFTCAQKVRCLKRGHNILGSNCKTMSMYYTFEYDSKKRIWHLCELHHIGARQLVKDLNDPFKIDNKTMETLCRKHHLVWEHQAVPWRRYFPSTKAVRDHLKRRRERESPIWVPVYVRHCCKDCWWKKHRGNPPLELKIRVQSRD